MRVRLGAGRFLSRLVQTVMRCDLLAYAGEVLSRNEIYCDTVDFFLVPFVSRDEIFYWKRAEIV